MFRSYFPRGERHVPAGTGIWWIGRLVFGAYGVIGGVVTFAVGALWGVLGSQLAAGCGQ
jgi:hypothetical protein